MQDEKRDDIQHTPITDPSVEPTVEEVEARQSRETAERLGEVEGRDVSEVLLARIEPEGRELYAINQNLEGAMLLSIAISLCTSAAVAPLDKIEPELDLSGTAVDDTDGETNPPRKAKSVLRKVGAAKSGGGKGSKGRDDKGKSPTGVRHWDRPAGRSTYGNRKRARNLKRP